MNVWCHNCKKIIGKVKESRIPDSGTFVTCPKCKGRVFVEKRTQVLKAVPRPAPTPPPIPKTTQSITHVTPPPLPQDMKTKVPPLPLGKSVKIENSLTNVKRTLGLFGAVLLFIGVFLPIIHVPLVGNLNYFQNGRGDGTIILFLAIVSLIFVILEKFDGLWITGVSSFLVLSFTFIMFHIKLSEVKSKMAWELAGNPFRGIADIAVQSIQLQWGWGILVIGTILILTSAAIKEPQRLR